MFELTLPVDVAKYLKNLYNSGVVVLEYGTGGSTFLALESNKKNIVFGCETDAKWLSRLSTEIAARNLNDRFFPVYQNIGETSEWGYPSFERQPYDDARCRNFSQAPRLAWEIMKKKNISPDVVLIDGRFRVASFINTFFNASKPCTIVFDDYEGRPSYHVVEKLMKPTTTVSRAAIFNFKPSENSINVREFLEIFSPYMNALY